MVKYAFWFSFPLIQSGYIRIGTDADVQIAPDNQEAIAEQLADFYCSHLREQLDNPPGVQEIAVYAVAGGPEVMRVIVNEPAGTRAKLTGMTWRIQSQGDNHATI